MSTPHNNGQNNGEFGTMNWRRLNFAFRLPEHLKERTWDALESASIDEAAQVTPSLMEAEIDALCAGIKRQLQGLADRAESRRKLYEEQEALLGIDRLKETIVSRRLRFVGGWLDLVEFVLCWLLAIVIVVFAWGNAGYSVNDAVQPYIRALLVAWPFFVVGLLFHEGAAQAGFRGEVASRGAFVMLMVGCILYFGAFFSNFGSATTADDIAASGVIQPDLRVQFLGQVMLELGAVWILMNCAGGKLSIVEKDEPHPDLRKALRRRIRLREKQDRAATEHDQYLAEIDRLAEAKRPYVAWEQKARDVISRENQEHRRRLQLLRARFLSNNQPEL